MEPPGTTPSLASQSSRVHKQCPRTPHQENVVSQCRYKAFQQGSAQTANVTWEPFLPLSASVLQRKDHSPSGRQLHRGHVAGLKVSAAAHKSKSCILPIKGTSSLPSEVGLTWRGDSSFLGVSIPCSQLEEHYDKGSRITPSS